MKGVITSRDNQLSVAPSHKHFKFCLPQMPCDNAHVFLLVLRSWCLLHSESRAVVKAQFHNVFKLTVKDGLNESWY